jgi:hypothetical protein
MKPMPAPQATSRTSVSQLSSGNRSRSTSTDGPHGDACFRRPESYLKVVVSNGNVRAHEND